MLLPFNPYVKVQQAQREHMAIMGSLAGLLFDYDLAKSQIMSSPEISSLQDSIGLSWKITRLGFTNIGREATANLEAPFYGGGV